MQPSAILDRIFQIRTDFSLFDSGRKWCLQADQTTKGDSTKLQVRPCQSPTVDVDFDLQKWKSNAIGHIFLADSQDAAGHCIKSTGRKLYVDDCESADNFAFDDVLGTIGLTKGSTSYLVGFDPTRRFSRLRLFKSGTFNDSLYNWHVFYEDFAAAAAAAAE